MVFQQFSFFVAWLHKTMSTHQFIDMLTYLFPYIPIAKTRCFTGISDNTFLLILDYLIAIQKLLFFLPCFSCLLSLSFSTPFLLDLHLYYHIKQKMAREFCSLLTYSRLNPLNFGINKDCTSRDGLTSSSPMDDAPPIFIDLC